MGPVGVGVQESTPVNLAVAPLVFGLVGIVAGTMAEVLVRTYETAATVGSFRCNAAQTCPLLHWTPTLIGNVAIIGSSSCRTLSDIAQLTKCITFNIINLWQSSEGQPRGTSR